MTSVRKHLMEQCAELNITVPEGASKKQIEALIDKYYETAAVITTDEGLRFRQTDKPIAEYFVDFEITSSLIIRAESEEAAREWVEDLDLLNDYLGTCEFVDIVHAEIINCNKVEEDS